MLNRLIDRPISVTMGLLVVLVLGVTAMRMLPISLIPDVDVPYITVQVAAPNLSAREIDESVVKPLRQQLIQVGFLEDIVTEAKDGSGTIGLAFSPGADMDYLFIEVNEKIDRSMSSLRGIERPKVLKSGATDIPAFYLNVTLKDDVPLPDETDRELFPVSQVFLDMSNFVSDVLAKRIEQLKEVAMVDISGSVRSELLIIPDGDALKRLGLSESSFESLIKAADIRLGSLTIRDGEYRYNVKFRSFASGKSDIENLYLEVGGKILQVKDIARVVEHPSKRVGLVMSDGKDAVTMAVIKQSDAKMADLKKAIGRLMRQFKRDYPEMEFKVTRDQTELLEYSINNLLQNIVVGILLACLVIFLFMKDFRSPMLVVFTIPTALIFSMLVFYLIGLTINIISLSGLVLGVGMMVDNTIVLIDNITARWQRGDSLRRAVVKGTSEVLAPMLSSMLTTCAVFIPLIFMSGIAGAMFYDQAMAIAIVLSTSYIVTATVVPVYYWWWYRKSDSFVPNRFLERLSSGNLTFLYERGVEWLVRKRWICWSFFAVSMAGIVLCFSYMPKEKLPEVTYTDTLLKVNWNDHLSLEQNTERVKELEEAVKDFTSQVTSMVGMQQFVLGHSGDPSVSEASVYLKASDAGMLAELKSIISDFLYRKYPHSIHSFESSGNIFDMVFASKDAELVARFRPVSRPELDVELLGGLTSDLAEGLPYLDIPSVPLKTDVLYVADPEIMALYGATYPQLVSVLRNALNENELFSIVQGDKTLPVVMGVDTRDIDDIVQNTFLRRDGVDLPVGAFMRQTYEEDLKSIVSGAEGNYYPLPLDLPDSKVADVMDDIRTITEDNGDFEVSFSGAYFGNRKMIGELILVLLVAIVLLYLILASQFESLVQPLIILSEIVIDIFASLVVLWICGASVNLMSMIGLVVVCGIVINDSILKIDTINRLRKSGTGLYHAILVGGHRRFKAIVMTSLTTILAVCPFLSRGNMGDDLQYPMSLVIIAGMVVGTAVSLFFVPVIYFEIYRKRK